MSQKNFRTQKRGPRAALEKMGTKPKKDNIELATNKTFQK